MSTQQQTEQETLSFRAPSLEEAVALAEQSLGSNIRVVAANTIRRGGIGGFFAADLGVEVSVALEDETIEQALERLLTETADEERTKWSARPTSGPRVEDRFVPSAPALATPTRRGLASPKSGAFVKIGKRPEASSMVPVEQVIEELQHLTAADAPLLESPTVSVPQAIVMPVLPPRVADIVRSASAAAATAQAAAMADAQLLGLDSRRDVPGRLVRQLKPSVPGSPLPQVERSAEKSVADIEALAIPRDEVAGEGHWHRHVELAVAATDQLIDSLRVGDDVKRLSVRIALRAGDQGEVVAEAEWEAS
jgi:hypothetical protein